MSLHKRSAIYTEEDMTVEEYRLYKLDILREDFYFHLTPEEEQHMKSLKTFPEVNSYFVTMLNKYLK